MDKDIPGQGLIDPGSDLAACINKVKHLSDCIEIANLINSELSIGKLLSNIMQITKKAFSADAVSMLLMDDKTGDLMSQIAMGDVGDEIKEIYRLKKGKGIAGFVVETGVPLNLDDVYAHPKFSPEYDRQTHSRTRAMLCVPLKIRGKIIGVIQVINKLTRPFIFSSEELEMLTTISSSAAVAIDTAKMHKLILRRQTLERDLKLAREVQQSFLPGSLPIDKTYRFAALNQPALEIGGDFYNFFKLPSHRLGIALGDVSGKGISASLFMARLTSDLQYFALLHPEPGKLLTQANKVLCKRAKRGMFVTLVYLVLDTVENRIQMANAGHVFPIYSDDQGTGFLGHDHKKGPPLGILPEIEYAQETFELGKNSSVTLYTDGVIEARNSGNDLFGVDALIKLITAQPNNPDVIIREITRSVDKFTQSKGRSDDLTLLVFSRDEDVSMKTEMACLVETEPVHLQVRSHPKNLKHIRHMMTKIMGANKVSKKESGHIILAVDEACSNIIRHSYKNDYTRKIDLRVRPDTNRVTILIADDGIKFDVNSIKPRNIHELKPGGLGLYIMRQVMDTIEFNRTSNGFNTLKMTKHLLS